MSDPKNRTCRKGTHRFVLDGGRVCIRCGVRRTRMPGVPQLLPLPYGRVYCELCTRTIEAGERAALWWGTEMKKQGPRVRARDSRGRVVKGVAAGSTERWRTAIALAGFAGLRIGEIRGLRWGDIDLERDAITVSRSLLPDGTPKSPKTEAGVRTIPLLPSPRRRLIEWKVRSPRTDDEHYVICTHDGSPVQQRNAQRALSAAKEASGLDGGDERLSWHSLRDSYASMLATDLQLPATTLARIVGHADAGFSLRVYAKDALDEAALVRDVLDRAAAARIGR